MAVAIERPEDAALLTVAEAASRAGVGRGVVRRWCAEGRLASVSRRAPGERFIRTADLDRHLAALAGEVPADGLDSTALPIGAIREQLAGGDALRRIAAEVSGPLDLPTLFDDVIADSMTLFSVRRVGLWLYDESRPLPLTLAAHHDVPPEVIRRVGELDSGARTAGLRAIRSQTVVIVRDTSTDVATDFNGLYERNGIASVCFVPIVFRGEPLGLLVLYHDVVRDWTTAQQNLVRSFADQMAAAIGNTRLYDSVQSLAARLRAIHDLALRLNRIRDLDEIASVIVEGTERLIEHDTIRVYRVDRATMMCEPIAFKGTFGGSTNPSLDELRMAVGEGLTGWAAEHNETVLVGDAGTDPRGLRVHASPAVESMLAVPMTFEDEARGVIVVSADGRDRFGPDDEATLTIFAGYAAQAIVNFEHLDQLNRQQLELEHQLASQRRLLEVNEELLSTLDPKGVLELIADSLRTIVPYDTLSVYRVDLDAGVRRVVLARDRFADVILDYAGPIGVGVTGWVIEHAEAVLANDVHLDPRSIQIPGTPFEPESMIVVPLRVGGAVIGTLNIGRMGDVEAHFSQNEFELTKLFAGQASIALENAETHGAVKVRAEHDALTGLRNHGQFQQELAETIDAGSGPFALLMLDLDAFKAFNDACGHPAGDALLVRIAGALRDGTRDGDAVYRYGGDEFAVILPGANRIEAYEIAERIRRSVDSVADRTGPWVSVTVGVACYPDDGAAKDELVAVADQSLYLAKPSSPTGATDSARHDPFLAALDQTAIALMDRHDPDDLLATILARAAALLGTPNGYIYLVEPDQQSLVVRHGIGIFSGYLGYRLAVTDGVGGMVVRERRAVSIDDYDAWLGRAADLPAAMFGAVVGVPLTSRGRVMGVIGLASGAYDRQFGEREIAALTRFAQLASIALDNADLVETARRGALYDQLTGLPNRDLLLDRVAHSLSSTRPGEADQVALILLEVDRFKSLNESLGHAVGDQVLAAVGDRLTACLRPGDTVARFAGDEFAMFLDGIRATDEVQRVAERVIEALRAPFALGDHEWFVNAGLGIAVGVPGRTEPQDLFREAEIALVQAKHGSAIGYTFFEPAMSAATTERIDLENDLRRAIERDELRLHYQPLIDLATGRIVGVEALARWQHPTRGLVAPLSFIPLAEETGLIIPIGRWVLETACRQAREWMATLLDSRLVMSVNLSARQFSQPDLVAQIAGILDETGLPPSLLELEITESVLMDQTETGTLALRALRGLGVKLVLDDFGTGYSSLSYLKNLPLDTIKIDRSFVNGLESDAANLPIVRAVIDLAHGLHMAVVAEGIETEAEMALLRELGCDRGQGFYVSRPKPAADLIPQLAARGAATP